MASNFNFLKAPKKITVILFLAMVLALPIMVSAADAVPPFQPKPFDINITTILNGIFNVLWPVIVTVIIIMFIWAGVSFMTAHGDPAKILVAKKAVLWGVAGVAVIILSVSAIAIVNSFVNPAPTSPGCFFQGESCLDDADCCSDSCNFATKICE